MELDEKDLRLIGWIGFRYGKRTGDIVGNMIFDHYNRGIEYVASEIISESGRFYREGQKGKFDKRHFSKLVIGIEN
jgi:hypothetical protein